MATEKEKVKLRYPYDVERRGRPVKGGVLRTSDLPHARPCRYTARVKT